MTRGGKRHGAGRKPRVRPFADAASPTLAVDKAPSEKEKRDVAGFIADGMTEKQIAIALKTDVESLRARFSNEIENGIAIARAQNVRRLLEAADGGNVAAAKRLDEKFSAHSEKPETTSPLGKKELAQQRADQLAHSGKYATPPPPGAGKKAIADWNARQGAAGTMWEEEFDPDTKGNLQ